MRGLLAAFVFGLVGVAAVGSPRPVPATRVGWHGDPGSPESGTASAADTTQFSHVRHAKLFPTCVVCHAGVVTPGQAVFPPAEECRECHNGSVEKVVPYTPPELPRTNLAFAHAKHAAGVAEAGKAEAQCITCHEEAGAPWMHVQFAALSQCFSCHGVTAPHLQAPDTACARCHVPLAQASRLTVRDIGALPKPPSHDAPDFALGGHGKLATAEPGRAVAASCATCHAQNFCVQCHVDAPEQDAIQALAVDARSTALAESLSAPPSHARDTFLGTHGTSVLAGEGSCATCHTRESCLTCHLATPRVASGLYAAGPGRGAGAHVVRHEPATHTEAFIQHGHGELASAREATCASCHVRQDCLECHRPNAAGGARYHPATFIASHPAAAYSRATSCNDCHNTRQFCTTCHKQSGLVANGPLKAGYHDAEPYFVAGHGQAARQSLETCVSCHAERDCLECHSAIGGRRFSPHGPDFDAARLKKKNPEMCTVCHGTNIPG